MEQGDLFFKYVFTDRGGNSVYHVYPADDHMTMLNKLGEIRIAPDTLTGEDNDPDGIQNSKREDSGCPSKSSTE
jgi:hypothetical protein